MSLKKTLSEMIEAEPDVYFHPEPEIRCLNFLLCTSPNGMQWKDGKVVPIKPRAKAEWKLMRENFNYCHTMVEAYATICEVEDAFRAGNRDRVLGAIAKARKLTLQDNRLLKQPVLIDFSLLTPRSLLWSVPDDICHDWLAAAACMCAKIMQRDPAHANREAAHMAYHRLWEAAPDLMNALPLNPESVFL